jgi:hypothetical protein
VSAKTQEEHDAALILAAEECPPEEFDKYHKFASSDEAIIRKLSAHGPVLLRGGRGSGKSALLIHAFRRMKAEKGILPVYVSLRYLPLLQSDGEEYIQHFCLLLSDAIQAQLSEQKLNADFGRHSDQATLQGALSLLAQALNRRIVLLFDDAAHIGREKPLEVFFDLFRTLSSSVTSCKASIYPGVTKFGIRFDVFNDSTVVDIVRADVTEASTFFPDVIKARYPKLAERPTFSDRLLPEQFANLLGRAVVGNLRGFILACNRFEEYDKVGLPEVTKCFLDMATDYFWPLMEEVAPKLGVYEPLVEPSREIFEAIVEYVSRSSRDSGRVPEKVLIHRQFIAQEQKVFEILEYLGFLARREASRALKSGGRGPVFAINLCNLLEVIPSKRLTYDMVQLWTQGQFDPAEIHSSATVFSKVKRPTLAAEHGLAILDKPIEVLTKSSVYPYGLTKSRIERLRTAGIDTVGELAGKSDQELDDIDYTGGAAIKRIRDVVSQAIWM